MSQSSNSCAMASPPWERARRSRPLSSSPSPEWRTKEWPLSGSSRIPASWRRSRSRPGVQRVLHRHQAPGSDLGCALGPSGLRRPQSDGGAGPADVGATGAAVEEGRVGEPTSHPQGLLPAGPQQDGDGGGRRRVQPKRVRGQKLSLEGDLLSRQELGHQAHRLPHPQGGWVVGEVEAILYVVAGAAPQPEQGPARSQPVAGGGLPRQHERMAIQGAHQPGTDGDPLCLPEQDGR